MLRFEQDVVALEIDAAPFECEQLAGSHSGVDGYGDEIGNER